jgi:predicted branched-subunit amino acid permease
MTMDRRRAILGDALGIGLAAGAYAISFGAISVASGLTVLQTQALSVLMFTGASQFALVGVLAAGGGAVVAVATAALLGTRNGFYALHMAPLLGMRGWRRLPAAQMTIDESTAMAVRNEDNLRDTRLAFWSTGLAIFILWNLGTLLGALGAGLIGDPATYGLDAAIPAAFLALLWPRLTTRAMRLIAAVSIITGAALTAVLPAGTPVLVAGAIGVTCGLLLARRDVAS